MKTALHASFADHSTTLKNHVVETALAIATALAPYAVAALVIFIYHEQFGV